MLTKETGSSLLLYLHLLGQEEAFGHKVQFLPENESFLSIPLSELSEEQAQALITDAKDQRKKMFEVEATWQ